MAGSLAGLIAELPEEFVERRAGLRRDLLLIVAVVSSSCIIAGAAEAGIFTRTEITAGFTLVTRSAKPAGCCVIASAALALDVSKARDQLVFGPAIISAAPTAGHGGQQRELARRQFEALLVGRIALGHFHLLDQWGPIRSEWGQSREAPGRCKKKWGNPSYNDLESGLILGHKRRLNIKFPKETGFTMMRSADGAISARQRTRRRNKGGLAVDRYAIRIFRRGFIAGLAAAPALGAAAAPALAQQTPASAAAQAQAALKDAKGTKLVLLGTGAGPCPGARGA